MAIYDFYDDSSGALLQEILETRGTDICPDHVRKCAHLIPAAEFRRERTLFAWPARQRFAIDNPADAWLSREYFAKTAHLIPDADRAWVQEQIDRACALFGLEPAREKKEAASVELTDDDFLLVITKEASEPLRLYPIHDPEHVARSVAWFPRNLDGELAAMRSKIAQDLLAACERHGVTPSEAVLDQLRPIKLSSLLSHLHQRVGLLVDQEREARHGRQIRKAAAGRGLALPYAMPVTPIPDSRLADVYEGLLKRARRRQVDETFWELFKQADTLSGFDNHPQTTPVHALVRELDDDIRISTCKLAGTIVNLPQLLDKVPAKLWSDVAPDLDRGDLLKVAETLPELPHDSQRMLYAALRGW